MMIMMHGSVGISAVASDICASYEGSWANWALKEFHQSTSKYTSSILAQNISITQRKA